MKSQTTISLRQMRQLACIIFFAVLLLWGKQVSAFHTLSGSNGWNVCLTATVPSTMETDYIYDDGPGNTSCGIFSSWNCGNETIIPTAAVFLKKTVGGAATDLCK